MGLMKGAPNSRPQEAGIILKGVYMSDFVLGASGMGEAPRQRDPKAENTVVRETRNAICIDPLNHGYIVVIGCQRFAIEDKGKLLLHLEKYLSDPSKIESLWLSGNYKI